MAKIVMKSAGHPFGNVLLFDPTPTSCGSITDGVAFEHAVCEQPAYSIQRTGPWVMSFQDLERAYLEAKKIR